jgi:hypothetical protein
MLEALSYKESELEAEMHTVHVDIPGSTETKNIEGFSKVLCDCIVFNSGPDHSCEKLLHKKLNIITLTYYLLLTGRYKFERSRDLFP